MQIENLSPRDVILYRRNARTHTDDQVSQIVASIREFGFTNPVLIDERNTLIAGHGRTAAARKMEMDSIPCIRLSGLSASQIRALRIADNQLALNAGWDYELLASELAELETEDYDISLIGFDDDLLDDLLDGSFFQDDDDPEQETDDTEPPDPPDDPVSVRGDIWLMGRHRLMCGDSTNMDDVERLVAYDAMDLFVTDPPYNVDYTGKTAEALTIENDSMADDDFRQFLRDVYATADSVMAPGAAFYVWHSDSEGHHFRGAAQEIGWRVRQCLIWKKSSFVLGRQDYHWQHEPCLYGWKDGAAHYWGGDRKQTTVLEFERPNRNGDHPTSKPVNLIEYLVRNSSRRGHNVLDLFGGSGSLLIACQNAGRSSFVMELDPRYVDVIVRRWQNHTGKSAVLDATGETFDHLASNRGGVNHSAEAANDSEYDQSIRA